MNLSHYHCLRKVKSIGLVLYQRMRKCLFFFSVYIFKCCIASYVSFLFFLFQFSFTDTGDSQRPSLFFSTTFTYSPTFRHLFAVLQLRQCFVLLGRCSGVFFNARGIYIQNPVKHLIDPFAKIVNYFRRTLHLRLLTGS